MIHAKTTAFDFYVSKGPRQEVMANTILPILFLVQLLLLFSLSSPTAWKGPYICIDVSVRVILIGKFSQVRIEQKNFADQSNARELRERICLPYFYVSPLSCMSWNFATSSQTNYRCWRNDTRPPTVLLLVSMCLHSAISILNNKQFKQIDGAPQHIKKPLLLQFLGKPRVHKS